MHAKDASPALPRPPRRVLCVIAAIALIDPLSHALLPHVAPPGTAPTGMHTLDTAIYLAAMDHAHPPWYSPYAHCGGEHADGDPSLYALPYHHLYGIAGGAARALGVDAFQLLGWLNGLGVAFYLYAVYAFLAIAAPALATRAFLLFSLSGGLGGLFYALAALAGLTDHPEFGRYFLRYFLYELNDGPRFQPWLMVCRLYYTAAFGCAFLGLAALCAGMRDGRRRGLLAAALLLALAAFINFRIGPMLGAAGALILLCHAPWRPARRIAWSAALLAGAATGTLAAGAMLAQNPELIEGVGRVQHTALWLSPFASAAFFYLFLAPGPALAGLRRAPAPLRIAGAIAASYLLAFTLLYIAWQAYYGNFLVTGEVTVALAISDYALLAAIPLGLLLARHLRPRNAELPAHPAPPWAAVWLLAFLAVAISAWGQGAFLRLTPERCVVVLGVPLALLGAAAIDRGLPHHPRRYQAIQAAMLACGLLSIAVAWTVTHGPLGYDGLQRHFSWTRWVYMAEADANTLPRAGKGVVLAPSLGAPLFGDVAVRQGNATVYGLATQDFSRQIAADVRRDVAQFFDPETPDPWRREKAAQWCARYIYCPATDPVDPATVAQLRESDWLEEIAAEGNAVLFRVR